tara:strand:- start:238 stop:2109 length:1872 start_codon:yes stop_codon:yes gene_type:complete
MGGGLMQLVAYGAQDIYLTGNPQITFFKVVYRRHTNFSMEAIEQSASGVARVTQSENEASFTVARNGDLIHKVYLTADASQHKIQQGSQIIKEVEISIGGQKIDRHTQEWHDIWNELTITSSKSKGFKAMTGDIGKGGHSDTQLVNSSMKSVKYVQIPLLFWFCRNPGLALPLIALQYHEVKIDFTFNILKDIGNHDDDHDELNLKLFVDYIYLDTDERRRFAQVSHEYLIEQLQVLETNDKISNNLNFNHPVKEIIWTSQGSENSSNYGSAQIKLNGHDRFSKQEEEYFQLRQPFDYHTSIPHQNLPLSAKYSEISSSFNNVYLNETGVTGLDYLNEPSQNLSDLDNTNFIYGMLVDPASTDPNTGALIPINVANELSDLNNSTLTNYEIHIPTGLVVNSAPPTTGEYFVMVFISDNINQHPFNNIFRAGENYDLFAIGEQWTGSEYQSDKTLLYPATFRVLETQSLTVTGDINEEAGTTLGGIFQFKYEGSDGAQRGEAVTAGATINLVVFGSMFYQNIVAAYNTQDARFVNYTIKEINEEVIDQRSHFEASTSHMTKKINVYSFALKPEEHQPSGTCNFSRIDTAQLITDNKIGLDHNIYAVNYNVLRIMSGMGGLAYSN